MKEANNEMFFEIAVFNKKQERVDRPHCFYLLEENSDGIKKQIIEKVFNSVCQGFIADLGKGKFDGKIRKSLLSESQAECLTKNGY
jgi:hypothetical protein